MSAPRPAPWPWILPLAAGVAALGLTFYSVTTTPETLRQIRRRQADLVRLQTLARAHATDRAAVAAVAAAGRGAPALVDAVRSINPQLRVVIQDRERSELIEGWFLQRSDVIVDDLVLADAGRLLAGLETLRPPWRVVEYQVTAQPGVAGRGRVVVTVEGLQTGSRPPSS